MHSALIVLEYLRVLLTWPVAAVAVAAILVKSSIGSEIAGALKRGIEIRAGERVNVKIQGEQSSAPAIEKPPQGAGNQPPVQNAEDPTLPLGWLWAEYWRFQFLDFYLQQHTKLILAWLAKEGAPRSASEMFRAWSQIDSPVEQNAILHALCITDSVKEGPGGYFPSPSGERFLRHLNNPQEIRRLIDAAQR